MNNVRNLIVLRARNPPSKIQRFKESKISKNQRFQKMRGGGICLYRIIVSRVILYRAMRGICSNCLQSAIEEPG